MKNIFVDYVIRSKNIPLPLLNKLRDKYLILKAYHLNQSNFSTFIENMPALIPFSLNKIVLEDNSLSDQSIADLLNILSDQRKGLK